MRRALPHTVLGFLLAASLVTFSLCVPYAATRFVLMNGQAVREALLEERKVPAADLEAFYRAREEALDWKVIATSWDDLALASLHRDAPGDKGILLQKRALAQSPGNPYGWMRLAYFSEKAGLRLEAGEALAASIKADPYISRLFLARFDLALRLGDAVDKETRARLPEMLRVFFKSQPRYLAYAAKEGYFVGVVQEMLSPYPEELRQFNKVLSEAK